MHMRRLLKFIAFVILVAMGFLIFVVVTAAIAAAIDDFTVFSVFFHRFEEKKRRKKKYRFLYSITKRNNGTRESVTVVRLAQTGECKFSDDFRVLQKSGRETVFSSNTRFLHRIHNRLRLNIFRDTFLFHIYIFDFNIKKREQENENGFHHGP